MKISSPASLLNQKYDFIIVGTGPAGIALLDSFKNSKKRILILEAGFKEYKELSQEIYSGQTSGYLHGNLKEYRKRQLGGSSNCWYGACLPFDDIDFQLDKEGKDYWPISLEDLKPYYKKAGKFYGIGDFYNVEGPPRIFKNDFKKIKQSYWLVNGEETVLTSKLLDIVSSSKNIDLCMKSNLVDVSFVKGSNSIENFVIEDYEGVKKKLSAD